MAIHQPSDSLSICSGLDVGIPLGVEMTVLSDVMTVFPDVMTVFPDVMTMMVATVVGLGRVP